FTLSTTGLDSKYVCWWIRAADKSGNLNNTMPYQCFQIQDTRAPWWSANSTTTPVAGYAVEHRTYWQDYGGLAGYIFSFDNCTGTFVNDSYVSLSGTAAWVNVTKVTNHTEGCTARWQVWVNDTAGNLNASRVFSYKTIKNDPPKWFNNMTNLTLAGWAVKHSTYWTDDVGMSGYIFSFHNGVNKTEHNISSELHGRLTVEKMGTGFLVQQGDYLFTGTDEFIPLRFPVDPSQSVALMQNLMFQENVTAGSTGDPAMNSDNALATVYVYNSTHLRIQRGSSADGPIRVGWQVLEALDNEFSVQRGELTLSGETATILQATLPRPVRWKDAMAWHYIRTTYTGNDGRVTQFYSNVTDNTTIQFERQSASSITGAIRWVVIEWNRSKIGGFYKGYTTGYGPDTAPFLDTIGGTITPSQSILIFQTHAIGDDGLDTSTTAGYIYNSTHVAFHNYASSFTRGVKWYVIDFGANVGNKLTSGMETWSTTGNLTESPLSPAVQITRSLAWLSRSSNGDGTAKPRHTQWWNIHGNSTHATSFHYERRYTGQAGEIRWEVLELPRNTAETNKTPHLYDNVLNGTLYEFIKNVTVTVHITDYITAGSTRRGNANPDIWVEFYNGAGWTGVPLGITGTGNFSVSIQDPTVLQAWGNQNNRDLRLRAINMDEFNITDYDLIAGDEVWVSIDSEREMFNSSWVP
ncbi:MAG: hypothetical protein D6706_20500, partial [Chloroflexi bacterium]